MTKLVNRLILRFWGLLLIQVTCFVFALEVETLQNLQKEPVARQTPTTQGGPVRVSPPSPLGFSILPTNLGLNLSPFAASLEVSFLPVAPASTAKVAVIIGYDRALSAFYGTYAAVRYERLERLSVGVSLSLPIHFSLQAGIWPHNPHLSDFRTTVLGIRGRVRAELPSKKSPVFGTLDIGLVQLIELSPKYLFDGRGEFGIGKPRLDRWGYATSGWRSTLTGVWSATAVAPSLALWGDGVYTTPLSEFSSVNISLRAGYRPAWPIPIKAMSELAVLGTLEARRTLAIGYEVIPDLLVLKRLTLEPRFRAWVDHALHVGADLTVSADTLVRGTTPVTLSGTLGYGKGVWVKLGLRVSP